MSSAWPGLLQRGLSRPTSWTCNHCRDKGPTPDCRPESQSCGGRGGGGVRAVCARVLGRRLGGGGGSACGGGGPSGAAAVRKPAAAGEAQPGLRAPRSRRAPGTAQLQPPPPRLVANGSALRTRLRHPSAPGSRLKPPHPAPPGSEVPDHHHPQLPGARPAKQSCGRVPIAKAPALSRPGRSSALSERH
ncbi:unnamed protein product [Rangifer tarandus platyrhynchus]|uniref:Uncharacterized protein n=2 Tax=Rangifer tarandus platyrhynchus TaxID=3082113 RepID=A0ABN8Z0M3_RANTA|nr:unnamed protein product [Rangifer tarandus platyrhynchus]CAI9702954.1 unnamed protein product [Rangifer tarandus platyrhynchus]